MTLRTALSHLGKVLDGQSIHWVLIGALAANRYRASPRLTNDIDLLLANTGEGIDVLEATLTEAGWSVHRADPGGELLRLTHAEYGVADLLIAGTRYQELAIQRALVEPIDDVSQVPVLAPEDVIVHKLIAGRYQDFADIDAILDTDLTLDEQYIEHWAGYWEVLDRWEQLNER
ncbi:MAG: nucleotidyl transferase AbiEii/AbiGii toxin family protein [Pseudomonadales bacterium]